MRKNIFLLALSAGLLPIAAQAQEVAQPANEAQNEIEMSFSSEQILLNNQAVEAVGAQNYQKAEQLFNSMLQLGEFNIIWMNLGRTYAKQNKCIEAKEAYSHVAISPKISDVPSSVIDENTKKFEKELAEQCSARILLSCSPEDLTVKIDESHEMICTTEPIAVVPGLHSVFGKTGYGFNTIGVETKAGETSIAVIEVIDYKKVVDETVDPEKIRNKSKLFKGLGYSFLGVGAAAAIGGFAWLGYSYNLWQDNCGNDEVMHNYSKCGYDEKEGFLDSVGYVNGKSREDIQKDERVGGIIGGIGVALLLTGIVLITVDAVSIQPELKDAEAKKKLTSYRLAPAISPEFSGLSFTGSF